MSVKLDGNTLRNVPITPAREHTYHDSTNTDICKYMARAQAAISTIRRTPGDYAGYALDSLCDAAYALANMADTLVRTLYDYGCTPED